MDITGFLARQQFGELLQVLEQSGYRCIGPVLRDGTIAYTDIHSVNELPAGVMIQAHPGSVRATVTQLPRYFSWASGPQALKPLLFSPRETLWQVTRGPDGALGFSRHIDTPPPTAVIGLRSCDLAALKLQDQHFMLGEYSDPWYAARRSSLLLVAVNCTHPDDTCFCTSTGDGPAADSGFDLLLDELDSGFVVQAGSDAGKRLMEQLPVSPVRADQLEKVDHARQAARDAQTRRLPAGDLCDALTARHDHPRWTEVAGRCLSCGSCSQVCPTCFCNSEHDEPRLDGGASEHVRQWDSCFTEGHSYIHGLVVRKDVRHRYRQWLTHKLGTWHRQYGRSGCVGCGRCIAWCPVGIDICEEAGALLGGGDDG